MLNRTMLTKFYKMAPTAFMVFCVVVAYKGFLTFQLWAPWDEYNYTYPLSVAESNAIRHFSLPLWEPLVNHGVPFAGMLGFSVWFPLTLLFSVIGYTQKLVQVEIVLIVVMAACFSYLALGQFTRNRWLRAAGGVAYATSGIFVGNAEHQVFLLAAAMFPLLHYLVHRWSSLLSAESAVSIGVVSGLLVLINYPAVAVMSAVFVVVETAMKVAMSPTGTRRRLIHALPSHALIISLSAILTSAASLVPDLVSIHHITRGALGWTTATQASLNLWNWLGSLTPAFVQATQKLNALDISMANTYLSLPILMFCLLAIPKSRIQVVLACMCTITVLISMGSHGYLYHAVYAIIPGMKAFRFPAALRYFAFFYLVSLGIHNASNDLDERSTQATNSVRLFLVFSGVFGVLALITVMRTLYGGVGGVPVGMAGELVVDGLVLLGYAHFRRRYKESVKISTFIFTFMVCTFSILGVYRNSHWTLGSADRPTSYANAQKNLYAQPASVNVSNKIVPSTMTGLISSNVFYNQFQNVGYTGSFTLASTQAASQDGQLPNVGAPILWFSRSFPTEEHTKHYHPSIITIGPNEISGTVETATGGYVYLEQAWYPGWHSTINGKPGSVFTDRGNHVVVKVPPGVSKVMFYFRPVWTVVGIYVSFAAWLAFCIFLLVRKAKDRRVGNYPLG